MTKNQLTRTVRANLEALDKETEPRAREAIQSSLTKYLRLLDRMEADVDLQSGIPSGQRANLGAAETPGEEAAYLQSQYDEIRPAPGETWDVRNQGGPWTAVNPPGMDVGDLAALAAPATRIAGEAIGAGLGAASPLPGGAYAGAGLGGALSGQLSNWLFRPQYTPTMGQRAKDVSVDAGLAMAGEGIGQILAKGGKAVLKNTIGTAQDAAANVGPHVRQDIPPSIRGALVPTDFNARLAGMMEGNPITGGFFLGRARQATDDAFENRLVDITGETSRGQAGDQARLSLQDYSKLQRQTHGEPFQKIEEQMGETLVPFDHTRNMLNEYGEAAEVPLWGAGVENPQLSNLASALGSADLPTYKQIKGLRSSIGRALNPGKLQPKPQGEAQLSSAYDALTTDMKNAVSNAGLGGSFDAANEGYTAMVGRLKSLDETFNSAKSPEDYVNRILTISKSSPSKIPMIRNAVESVSPGAWAQMQSAILWDAGQATAGKRTAEKTSMQSFLTRMNQLGNTGSRDDALKSLFGDVGEPMRDNVDDLISIAQNDRAVWDMINRSRTSSSIMAGMSPSLGMASLGASPGTSASLAAVPLIATNAAAMWMTRPGFVRKVAKIAQQTGGDKKLFDGALSRLIGQGSIEAGAREPIVSTWESPQR